MAFGDLSAVLDSLEFDSDAGQQCEIIHISGDIFLIVYIASSGHLTICTVDLDREGAIGGAVIDSWELNTFTSSMYPQAIHVGDTFYAIFCHRSGGSEEIYTLNIANDGTITKSLVDSLTAFGSGIGRTPGKAKVINVTGTIYAFVYDHGTNGTSVSTVDIDASGNIGVAIIDTIVVNASPANRPTLSIAQVNGKYFVVTDADSTGNGWAYTLKINANGTIDAGTVDTWEFDGAYGGEARIINTRATTFAVVHIGQNDVTIRTVTISAVGIFSAELDNLVITASGGQGYPDIVRAGGNVYIVAYFNSSNHCSVASFTILDDGTISAVIGSLEVDSASFFPHEPHLIRHRRKPGTIGMVNTSTGSDGWLRSFTVEVPGAYSQAYFID